MRIASLNVWFGQTHGPLLDYLPRLGADIYCFQEVHDAPGGTPEQLTWPANHGWHGQPVRPNLFREIASVLPGHRGRFFPGVHGPLVDEEGAVYLAGYGIATFVGKHIPIIGERVDFVAREYLHDGWGEQPQPRNAHCIRLDCEGGAPLVVAHMHGVLPRGGKGNVPIRTEQAKRFADIIASVAKPGNRIIACGDWNLLPDGHIFSSLQHRFGLQDLVTSYGFTDTRTSYYKKPDRHSNYMCVSPGIEVVAFNIPVAPEVSDHRPLILDIA